MIIAGARQRGGCVLCQEKKGLESYLKLIKTHEESQSHHGFPLERQFSEAPINLN